MRWAALLIYAGTVAAQSPSPHRLRADMEFLSSKLLDGRPAGTRGDEIAIEYVRGRIAALGLKPQVQEVPLGVRQTRNVVAVIAGTAATAESVVFTAPMHAANDNASGIAALLEIARLWEELEPKPLRTAVFAFIAGGDGGMAVFAAQAPRPVASVRLRLNLPPFPLSGRANQFLLAAQDQSPVWLMLRQTFERYGLRVESNVEGLPSAQPDVISESGIPSFTLRPISADAVDSGNVAGAEQVVRLGVELGLALANLPVR